MKATISMGTIGTPTSTTTAIKKATIIMGTIGAATSTTTATSKARITTATTGAQTPTNPKNERAASPEAAPTSRGLHRKCHEAWSKKPEFASRIAQKRRDVIAKALARISTGPWHAVAWWLERTCPEEFGQKPKPLVNVQNVVAQSNRAAVDDAMLERLSARMERYLAIERKCERERSGRAGPALDK
jgi:hypothetical protein